MGYFFMLVELTCCCKFFYYIKVTPDEMYAGL